MLGFTKNFIMMKNIRLLNCIYSEGVDNMNEASHELNEFIQSAVEQYAHTVAKTAFSYLKNVADAEDITQEVFLTLMQNEKNFKNDEHLKAWLIRVAINKCKNHLKSSWFKNRNPILGDIPDLSKEENEVLSAVLSLKIKYRIPLHLYYYEGYSIKEIAKIMAMPESTVGTRLARGRKILKDMLGEIYDEWTYI